MRLTPLLLGLVACSVGFPGTLAAQTLPFGISLPPSLNFAASPSPVGSGARAAGQANAFIGVADDATAASHNPGGLLQLLRPEASVVGSYFRRLEDQRQRQPDPVVENQTLDSAHLNYLSAVYPFEILQRNVVVSFNVQRLFDLRGATDVASRFSTVNGTQRVRSRQEGGLFTLSPAVAVEITPALALGVAFNVWPDLFDNGWQQNVSVTGHGSVNSGSRIVRFISTGQEQEKFAFQGFNLTAGFLWQVSPLLSLGGVLHTPFTAQVTRTHSSTLTVTLLDDSEPVTSARNFRETLDMDMPWAYGLGVALRLTERLRLSLDVSRVHWSALRLAASTQEDVLLVENGAPSGKGRAVLQGDADDTTTVRLGAQYLWPGPKIALRAGGFYDPEPGARGTDHFWGFSVGPGITLKQVVVDVAYTFRTGSVENDATNTSVRQHNLLFSTIYHF